VFTLDINVYNQSFAYSNHLIVFTFNFLISLSIVIIFTNASLKSNMSLCYNEFKKSKNKEFNNVVFEQIAQEIIERRTMNILTISKNIKFKNMSMKQVVIRMKKIIDLDKREK